MTSPIKLAEENTLNNNKFEEIQEKQERIKITKEEIEILVDKKRSELDIKIFDLVTRNQVEEKKIEDLYEAEENEEEKAKLLNQLQNLIKINEDKIEGMKE